MDDLKAIGITDVFDFPCLIGTDKHYRSGNLFLFEYEPRFCSSITLGFSVDCISDMIFGKQVNFGYKIRRERIPSPPYYEWGVEELTSRDFSRSDDLVYTRYSSLLDSSEVAKMKKELLASGGKKEDA